jgi:hypothetical protein
MNNDNFKEKIILTLNLKYVYQPILKGLKLIEKGVFFKAINRVSLDHLYSLNLLKKKG